MMPKFALLSQDEDALQQARIERSFSLGVWAEMRRHRHRGARAGERSPLVSGRFRNLLCGTFSEGNKTWTQSELLALWAGYKF